jgi:septal ring factor EnvC (AmiA/AmiB activator)
MPRSRLALDQISTARLEEILAGRRSKIAKLERQRKALQRRLDALEGKIALLGGHAASARGGRVHNKKSLPETIFSVLSRQGGPMTVGDIVAGVRATGYKSNSAAFRGIVNQALVKDERFKSVSRGIYRAK